MKAPSTTSKATTTTKQHRTSFFNCNIVVNKQKPQRYCLYRTSHHKSNSIKYKMTEESKESITLAPLGDIVDLVIHPLVLLSAADHYHRVARGTRKRVVGVLLGSVNRGSIDATNSFAVPFEEDNKNPVSDSVRFDVFCLQSL
jgi:hypothetical protein